MSSLQYFHFPTEIIFGSGSSKEIFTQLSTDKYKKVLVVSDPGILQFGFFKDILENLQKMYEVNVFSQFSPNPLSNEIDDVKKIIGEFVPQIILGIGGGASLDVAKALSISIGHRQPIMEYDEAIGGDKKIISANLIPVWAVPTTSGTGSEVGRSAVISDSITRQKKIIFHPKLIPTLVFCDPVLTESLPSRITANTGIDAFVHLFEAYCAPGFHPMADGIALEGMHLISKSFIKAVNAPDLEARTNMMAAAMMGAVAFQKGLGNIHSCAHSLSACFDIHHGLANGVMLPYGAQINMEYLGKKAQIVSRILGSVNSTKEDLPHLLMELITETGIPTNLGAFNIKKPDCEKLSEYAFQDGCHLSNCRPMTKEMFHDLFLSAI